MSSSSTQTPDSITSSDAFPTSKAKLKPENIKHDLDPFTSLLLGLSQIESKHRRTLPDLILSKINQDPNASFSEAAGSGDTRNGNANGNESRNASSGNGTTGFVVQSDELRALYRGLDYRLSVDPIPAFPSYHGPSNLNSSSTSASVGIAQPSLAHQAFMDKHNHNESHPRPQEEEDERNKEREEKIRYKGRRLREEFERRE